MHIICVICAHNHPRARKSETSFTFVSHRRPGSKHQHQQQQPHHQHKHRTFEIIYAACCRRRHGRSSYIKTVHKCPCVRARCVVGALLNIKSGTQVQRTHAAHTFDRAPTWVRTRYVASRRTRDSNDDRVMICCNISHAADIAHPCVCAKTGDSGRLKCIIICGRRSSSCTGQQ